MIKEEQEKYKDYLVRKVTEEIGIVFRQKMDEAKKEIQVMEYKTSLENTEEILKNYKTLKEHIILIDQEKKKLYMKLKNIKITKKKSILSNIFEIIEKILKVIIYFILAILLTIGGTVLINSQTREFLFEIFKNIF